MHEWPYWDENPSVLQRYLQKRATDIKIQTTSWPKAGAGIARLMFQNLMRTFVTHAEVKPLLNLDETGWRIDFGNPSGELTAALALQLLEQLSGGQCGNVVSAPTGSHRGEDRSIARSVVKGPLGGQLREPNGNATAIPWRKPGQQRELDSSRASATSKVIFACRGHVS